MVDYKSFIKDKLKKYYSKLPIYLKLSRTFWDTYLFLRISKDWDKEMLKEYQLYELKKLLNHCYKNVKYYKFLFDENGINPDNFHSLNDLKKIPFLTKDEFKKNQNDIVAENLKKEKVVFYSTIGTTGKPLQFYQTIKTDEKELAFIYHIWEDAGVKVGDPILQIRGGIIDYDKVYHYNARLNILRLSPIINDKQTVIKYIELINDFKPKFLHGYPGIISLFAQKIKDYKINFNYKFKCILFASEKLYKWQERITEEVFNCPSFIHYGLAEKVVLAKRKDGLYYCIPQYGIVEFDSETNEIIGTGFLNYLTPFIRYRTSDIALKPTEESKSNYFPVFEDIEGRKEDFIVSPEHGYITPAVITHPFKNLKNIMATQIIQQNLNSLLLKIVPVKDVNESELENEIKFIKEELIKIVGSSFNIDIKVVDNISDGTKKFRWIISDISAGKFEKGFNKNE